MKKKYYIKPFVETLVAQTLSPLQASGPTGNGGVHIAGGANENQNTQDSGQQSGGDGEFEGQGAKDFNAWSSWDE